MLSFTLPKWRALSAALFLTICSAVFAADLDALRQAGKRGDTDAMRQIIETLGRSDKQEDKNECLRWLTALARAGDLEAQITVATLYTQDAPELGTKADLGVAEEFYHLALKQSDDPLAEVINFYNARKLPEPKYHQFALERLLKYANGGNAHAQILAAQTYVTGAIVPKDEGAGVTWLKKAIAQDSEQALLTYANYLFEGIGMPKDPTAGMKVLTDLAAEDSITAQYYAGIYYRDGTYVKADPVLAAKYLRQVAEAGQPDGQLAYAKLLQSGTGVDRDPTAALGYWTKLANDAPEAAYQAGLAYRDGNGTAKDLKKAVEYLRVAAARGNAEAKAALPAVERLVPVKYQLQNAFLLGGEHALREKDRYVTLYSYRGRAGDEVKIEVYGRVSNFITQLRTEVKHLRLFVDDGGGKFEAVNGLERTVRLKGDGRLLVKISTAEAGQKGDAAIMFSTTRITADAAPAVVTRQDTTEDRLAAGTPNTMTVPVLDDDLVDNDQPVVVRASSSSFDPILDAGPATTDTKNWSPGLSDDNSGGGTTAQLAYQHKGAEAFNIRIRSTGNKGGIYRLDINRSFVWRTPGPIF